jgi:hypothetical protein
MNGHSCPYYPAGHSSEGELVEGVTTGDMGPKTIGNDLDNAWIKFDRWVGGCV